MIKKRILFYLFILIIQTGTAQISNYTFTQEFILSSDSNTPRSLLSTTTYLVPETTSYKKGLQRLFINPNSMVTGTSHAEGEGLPIGFNFIFDGDSFDRFAISSNGYIRLGKSGQNFTILNDTIAGSIFGSDLPAKRTNIISICQTNSSIMNEDCDYLSIQYGTIGFPGERQLIIEFSMSSALDDPGFIWNYRIILSEGTNKIQFILPSFSYNSGINMQVAVGLRGGQSTNDLSNLNIRKVEKGVDASWLNSRAGTSASDLCDMTKTFYPPASNIPSKVTIFVWTPPASNTKTELCNSIYFRDNDISSNPAYVNAYYTIAPNATDISVTPVFEWIENNDPSNTYDLYLSTDISPQDIIATGLTSQIYSVSNSTKTVRAVKYQSAQLSPNTDYYYKIVQYNNGQKTDSCTGKFTTANNAQYCIPKGRVGGNGYIANISLNTLSYSSPGRIPPTNRDIPGEIFTFTDTGTYTTSLQRDVSYTFSIKLLSAVQNNSLASTFIDFNQDGDFNDTGERFDMDNILPGGTKSISISVPSNAVLGKTKLRVLVRTFYTPAINPCDQVNDIDAAQDYIITILPASGCETFSISSSVSNVSCFNGNDGAIQLNIIGGTQPYTISWTDITSTSDLRDNLPRGIYQASATDANGCLVSIPLTPVLQPAVISIDTTTASDKSTDLTVSGGASPYSYLWSNGDTYSNPDDMLSGIYNLTVTDANNCQVTKNNILIKAVTAINEKNDLKVLIYPNPASSRLYIQLSDTKTMSVQIINAEGVIVKETKNMTNEESLDLTILSQGFYFIKIYTDNGSSVVKLIKQ